MSRSMKTSEPLGALPLMLLQGHFLANRIHQRREDEIAATVISGKRCAESFKSQSPLGSLARMLLNSTVWHSRLCSLTWKVSITKRQSLKFRLVPWMRITSDGGYGFSATPTATANQACPSMRKWPGCRNIVITPEIWEKRMGFPRGWTDLDA